MALRHYTLSFSLVLSLLLAVSSSAQTARYHGSWGGSLDVGTDLPIIFHVQDSAGKISAKADSPKQGFFGIPCDTAFVQSDSLHIGMRAFAADYRGILINDSTISGSFTQGASLPLTLKRVAASLGPVRPQTPATTDAYLSQDVTFMSRDRKLSFAGTVTSPKGNGSFPAILLISGSGPQNRDGEIYGHKPFSVLADAFTRNGFVVLRVDERGTGQSTGVHADASSADFANDANAAFDFLLTLPQVNKKKAGMIGHSEGGLIAPVAAAKRKDVNFLVLLAAPGIRIVDLMGEQNAAILKSIGTSDSAITAYIPFYKKLMTAIIQSHDTTAALNKANILMKHWVDTTNPGLVFQTGLSDEATRADVLAGLVKVGLSKWFKYFFAYDPQPTLQKAYYKVLALNGGRDLQVLPVSNIKGIEVALGKSKSKKWEAKVLPGLNHLFQKCTTCSIDEYGQLTETFSPEVIALIADWLNREVK